MTPEDKELCERLNKWGASGHTMELFIGKRNLGHDCMEASDAIERLSAEVESQRHLKEHWMSNHDNVVHRLRLATQRPDLPVDRVPAIKQMEELQKEVAALRAQIAEAQPVGYAVKNSYETRVSWYIGKTPKDGTPLYLHPAADAKDAERKIVESIVDATLDELDEPNRVRKAVVRIMRRELDAAMKGGA